MCSIQKKDRWNNLKVTQKINMMNMENTTKDEMKCNIEGKAVIKMPPC